MTMTPLKSDFLEKMRQQFDNAPYPRTPLEQFPKNLRSLYIHSLVTAYYRRNQKVVTPAGKLILDAGCGTGYKSLELAIANPGAKVVGIDLSPASVDLAQKRLQYHNIENVEFHAIALEDLPSLGMQFDYINNDEVLYLLPDPIAGLKAMREALKPDGVLRTNFHSSLQRSIYYSAQKFFKQLGFMLGTEPEAEVKLVRETMRCVKNNAFMKVYGWNSNFETDDETVLANYLLEGDKGWTILELFEAIEAAELEFISMVNWREWDLLSLFDNLDEMPLSVMMSLSDQSIAEQLYLCELLNPRHRLLDVWCGLPEKTQEYEPISQWSDETWQSAIAHLHPQVVTTEFREALNHCVTGAKIFELSRVCQLSDLSLIIDSQGAGCLLPLLEMPRSINALVQWWQKLRPFNPVTQEPTSETEALERVKGLLLPLEENGYVMIERNA
ncbi:class I SAM-dependent methyltransferase [Leptolyngbya sp. NIES-2104]|uniref:class I SAM-dependent methyltransferase n=1 Tax=Leptolyngbya sp. NIES-2104 TaxID=1552121 RepID=UPI0006ECAB9B|nr:methyltransferase domain-containing protein [Leptolyngbya sp. NIES-2104]GAP93934.1 3-demethylubiquinone-9 3-methyltransferase [Leptolyngbya sp. NIES-2104]